MESNERLKNYVDHLESVLHSIRVAVEDTPGTATNIDLIRTIENHENERKELRQRIEDLNAKLGSI